MAAGEGVGSEEKASAPRRSTAERFRWRLLPAANKFGRLADEALPPATAATPFRPKKTVYIRAAKGLAAFSRKRQLIIYLQQHAGCRSTTAVPYEYVIARCTIIIGAPP